MSRPAAIPEALRRGPFLRSTALELGLSSRQLQGRHFRRLFPEVWSWTGHVLTHTDWIDAARLAMPPDAHVSHITRIQAAGLDLGPTSPLHLTVSRDLHLDTPGIFLHRTEVLPPTDGLGVRPAAAFIGHAATARMIDLIKIGDWLLHHEHMSVEELLHLARRQPWRPGAGQATAVAGFLDGRAESLAESETRAVVVFAGLPRPAVNVPFPDDAHGRRMDMLIEEWNVAIEFEGGQHFTDGQQIARDIGRYAELRRLGIDYLQVTRPMLDQPRALAISIHARLVQRGYRGGPPRFDRHWASLFERVRPPRRWPSNVKIWNEVSTAPPIAR